MNTVTADNAYRCRTGGPVHLTELLLTREGDRLARTPTGGHAMVTGITRQDRDTGRVLWARPRPGLLVIQHPAPLPRGTIRAASVLEHRTTTPADRWEPGQTVQLALIGNPVLQDSATRARSALPPEEWAGWLVRKLAGVVSLAHVDAQLLPTAPGSQGPRMVTVTRVAYAAAGTVADPGALDRLRVEGVGRGKAYGCGLLLATPYREGAR